MTETLISIRDLHPGQIWREREKNGAFSREIISVTTQGLPSVEWRRPGSMGSRWCDSRRFRKWIVDTKADLS